MTSRSLRHAPPPWTTPTPPLHRPRTQIQLNPNHRSPNHQTRRCRSRLRSHPNPTRSRRYQTVYRRRIPPRCRSRGGSRGAGLGAGAARRRPGQPGVGQCRDGAVQSRLKALLVLLSGRDRCLGRLSRRQIALALAQLTGEVTAGRGRRVGGRGGRRVRGRRTRRGGDCRRCCGRGTGRRVAQLLDVGHLLRGQVHRWR